MPDASETDRDETVEALNDLLRLDHETSQAYAQAVDALVDPGMRAAMLRHRSDHQRHLVRLSRLILRLGGEPLDLVQLPPGPLVQDAQTAAEAGNADLLRLLRQREVALSSRYLEDAERPFPPEVRETLQRYAREEERHREWLEGTLAGMGVLQAPPPAGPADALKPAADGGADSAKRADERGPGSCGAP